MINRQPRGDSRLEAGRGLEDDGNWRALASSRSSIRVSGSSGETARIVAARNRALSARRSSRKTASGA